MRRTDQKSIFREWVIDASILMGRRAHQLGLYSGWVTVAFPFGGELLTKTGFRVHWIAHSGRQFQMLGLRLSCWQVPSAKKCDFYSSDRTTDRKQNHHRLNEYFEKKRAQETKELREEKWRKRGVLWILKPFLWRPSRVVRFSWNVPTQSSQFRIVYDFWCKWNRDGSY